MSLSHLLSLLAPYQFSVLAVTVFPVAAIWYALGMRRLSAAGTDPGFWRPLAFFTGIALCYGVMHTYFDYLGQYLFFMHRAQHLVLHHIGALLIALGNPAVVMAAALPAGFPRRALPVRAAVTFVHWLQQPVIASVLFVGVIYFWLWPAVHFDAMLSHKLYLLMNWSMLVDGVLFWLVVVDPRPPEQVGKPGYGARFLMLFFTVFPQILLGAYITFSTSIIYKVYSVCGRAWPIAPGRDQTLGGLLTWIPPSMMGVAAALVVLVLLVKRDEARGEALRAARAAESAAPGH